MKVIAIANTKGGTGKTTTTQALGRILSDRMRVLMVDLDPQASLTKASGIPAPALSIADVLSKRTQLRQIVVEISRQLHLAPASRLLTATEYELAASPTGMFALSKALQNGPYDVVLIDCIPALSQLTTNALVAADGVVIPCQPQGNDIAALPEMLQLVEEVRGVPQVKAEIIGILPTFYDARLGHHADAIEAMKAGGYKVLPAIGRSVRVAEAAAAHQSVLDYAGDNARAEEYRALAKELTKWLNAHR